MKGDIHFCHIDIFFPSRPYADTVTGCSYNNKRDRYRRLVTTSRNLSQNIALVSMTFNVRCQQQRTEICVESMRVDQIMWYTSRTVIQSAENCVSSVADY